MTFVNSGNKDTRSGFGDALIEIGQRDPRVVALCADLTGSVKMDAFAQHFPERFFQCGIAEANMMSVAAGLAIAGKIPFAGTFAGFATGRVYDQIRQSIAYSKANVKIVASHAGITLGEDGATHQIMEDIGLMRMLPNMAVVNPCDYNQTKAATFAAAAWPGPLYLRFGRPALPNFTHPDQTFEIGKALLMREGADVSIFATGHLVWEALLAADALAQKGISAEIINIHTIKPLDTKAILTSAAKTRSVLTAEEHLIAGGLGEAVAALLARELPTRQAFIAVDDKFGQSGKPDELLKAYGLDAHHITKSSIQLLQQKP
jgi:transketolase